ncbi:hypothetical protein [Photobacterium kishitanii]|nr:hypothetical protein [Photobacterium kishitanii]
MFGKIFSGTTSKQDLIIEQNFKIAAQDLHNDTLSFIRLELSSSRYKQALDRLAPSKEVLRQYFQALESNLNSAIHHRNIAKCMSTGKIAYASGIEINYENLDKVGSKLKELKEAELLLHADTEGFVLFNTETFLCDLILDSKGFTSPLIRSLKKAKKKNFTPVAISNYYRNAIKTRKSKSDEMEVTLNTKLLSEASMFMPVTSNKHQIINELASIQGDIPEDKLEPFLQMITESSVTTF